jgi:tetratricopeptide (TPR) repeat protein
MAELNTPASTASAPGTGTVTDARALAAQLFNETWRLMELEERTRADDDRMIHTAHASRYHWGQVADATPAHLARGEWQISRVYAVLGRSEPALHHARRVLDLCEENGIGDWDLAFAHEALARAHAVAGDAGRAREYTDQALAAAEEIADDEDRDLVLGDLETIPGQPRYW